MAQFLDTPPPGPCFLLENNKYIAILRPALAHLTQLLYRTLFFSPLRHAQSARCHSLSPKVFMNDSPCFAELGLSPEVLSTLDSIGYQIPSTIQQQAIPVLLAGHNLLGTAQTGTGKTAAFALPVVNNLDLECTLPQALVLTPTRELAMQVAASFETYGVHIPGFSVLALYGGADVGAQLRALRGTVHVVVGTPGRLLDHLRRETLNLGSLRTIVLDEADEMLKMGFLEDVESILSQAPANAQRVLFSATMGPSVQQIIATHLGDAKQIRIQNKTATVENIRQRYMVLRPDQKQEALHRLLEVEDYDAVMVFARTKGATVDIADALQKCGFSAEAINGDLSQALRERTIERFKDGRINILVATDVAARGLDVERVTHVVNYDIPHDPESYVHRIGRTGRAGRSGEAILFASRRDQQTLRNIERLTRHPMESMEVPTSKQIGEKRVERFRSSLLKSVQSPDLKPFRVLLENLSLEEGLDVVDVAAALVYQAQKEKPFFPNLPNLDSNARAPRREERESRESNTRRSKEDNPREITPPQPGMERYYLAVGYDHQITPGDIVGAIAGEAGMQGRDIGKIRMFDGFTTVELPEGMPGDTYKTLQKMRIRAHQARFRIMTDEPPPRRGEGGDKPRFKDKRAFGDKSRFVSKGSSGKGGFAEKPGNFEKRKRKAPSANSA